MFAMLSPTEFALAVLVPVTIVFLLLMFLVVRLSRSQEILLIVLGVLTGVYAVWCNQAAGEVMQARVGAGQAGVSLGTEAAGVLGRIAILLVLSGLAKIILSPWTRSVTPSGREEGIRVHQD
jgi:hypothetical protein